MKLLLAEDTKDLNNAIKTVLEMEEHHVDAVFDGEQAMERILSEGYDVIILDIMMPKLNGIEVLTQLRDNSIRTPVLLLTAKAEVEDRVLGLDSGADDYLTKPFAMKELLARVRALGRRGDDRGPKNLSFEDITLEAESLELRCENTVRLSMKEYELMEKLILNSGSELDAASLLKQVWPEEPEAGEDTLWLYISYLRNKLGSVASKTTITGQKGGTYRLVRS
ncbi:MAG: response regulator transcription factor [Lachnospiraceae bacterium]|nr:response regulator transcription factor [Lachnospiraceae bacterium]